MGSRGHIIHFSCSCGSNHSSTLHQAIYLMRCTDCPLTQTLYEYTTLFIFTNLQRRSFCFQQVAYVFIVNLQVTCSDHKGTMHVSTILNISENLFHSPWNNTPLWIILMILEPFHCICFTSASLSICQYSCVITFED